MAPSSEIERRVGDYYSGKLREHGATHSGVDWNSEESQRLRFEQLLAVVDIDAPFSINDWGCGYGALVEHLDAAGAQFTYVGYDVSEPMVQAARARLGDAPGRVLTTSESDLPVADYTVASGIFNVLAGAQASGWEEYVRGIVRRMAALSRRGIAFNMLTSYSDPDRMRPDLHYADPCGMFDWCKRNLSRHVALLHDYGLWEFTMLVRFDDERQA
jgi:SAM-dependent methyltransferase